MADMLGCGVTSRRLVLVSNCLCLLRCNFTIFYNCPIHNITVCEQSDRPASWVQIMKGFHPDPDTGLLDIRKAWIHTGVVKKHITYSGYITTSRVCVKKWSSSNFSCWVVPMTSARAPRHVQAACHTTAIPDTGPSQARSLSWAGILAWKSISLQYSLNYPQISL